MIKKIAEFLFLLLLFLTGVDLYGPELPQTAQEGLAVHYIDVGQADCTLLESDGEFALIDGGNVTDGRKVVAYLQKQGVQELEAVFCTHPHEDHAGGLAAVLAVFPVEQVFAPTATYASTAYDDFIRYADQQRLEIQIPEPGTQLTLGGAEMTVLGPVKSYADVNNTSLILRVEYGETVFLFTGDAEAEAEEDLRLSGADLRCNVLHVGHHGSATASCQRFLDAAWPEYAVISVGKDNPYGHPHGPVLSRLEKIGAAVYRTDRLGTVRAVSDGESITFTFEKQLPGAQQ